jgi:BirA family biotin operon repressor/biotin-[acetyl-CoA-carboxylase] ligase
MSPADRLDAEQLRAAVAQQRIGHRVVFLEETTSTNDAVAEIASQNREGVVVFAERQTAGRGQYGRRWESAPGKGLWLSILLRPQLGVADSSRLTDLLAQTIAKVVRNSVGALASIKPPNDVYIGGRKIAGVLVEMRVAAEGNYFAIAGVGINVNHELTDFPPELRESAGSLALALGKPIDRTRFAVAFLRRLEINYAAAAL